MKPRKLHEHQWNSMKVCENLWTSMKTMNIYENLWKSMDIYENIWTYVKYMNIYGIYWFWKKGGVILYVRRKWYLPISVLQRGTICLNGRNSDLCVGEIYTFTCNTHVKITFFMNSWVDPTVITYILAQTVSLETIIKSELCTKVYILDFPAKTWTWKMGEMDLATKSRPPDCGITSVLSREYVCCWFQLTKNWNLIGIDEQTSQKHAFWPNM